MSFPHQLIYFKFYIGHNQKIERLYFMESTKTESYRFSLEDEKGWKDHLALHGFVVISQVISSELCQQVVKDMRITLTKFAPNLKMNDESTWGESPNYPFMLNGGMIQYIGHTKFQWTMREKATAVFSKVWDVLPTELATSFDGFCYMDGRRNFDVQDISDGLHSDQSPLRNQLWSVQGLFSLCDCGPNDGGLVIVPDTHKIHHEFFEKLGRQYHESDWYAFSKQEKQDPVFKNVIKICGKAGDFMMWDSRTFHGNTKPVSNNIRACVYVCQIPKSEVPDGSRNLRKEAWKNKRCASHHPGNGFRVFPVVPRKADPKYADLIGPVSVKDEDLTDLQKSLLCIDEEI